MKKIITGILSIIYITLASGVGLSMHYCMGKVIGVDYSFDANSVCHKCGMKNNKDCCHTEFKMIKLTDDQQVVKESLNTSPTVVSIFHYDCNMLEPIQGSKQIIILPNHAPPDQVDDELYLSHRVFRI